MAAKVPSNSGRAPEPPLRPRRLLLAALAGPADFYPAVAEILRTERCHRANQNR